jgi:hypothetical protein
MTAATGIRCYARAAAWCAVVIGTFALIHPYAGITHDGILYLGQALARLKPEIYDQDVFFRWGSQDRYTVFSPIYAWLIVRLGIEHANLLLVALAQALFLGASFFLVRALVPAGLRGYAMLVIACSNGAYGGYFIFHTAEPFVTPRTFVEAGTLAAVALLIRGRAAWSLALLCGLALLHPLMALAGMLFWWMYQVLQDRRWAALAILGVVPLALALYGMVPFSQLLEQFDGQWLAMLSAMNPHIFPLKWTLSDWSLVAVDVVQLMVAIAVTTGVLRSAAIAGLATTAAALGIGVLGADLSHDVLITNLQPWRALWIVHWLAIASLAPVAVRLWAADGVGRLLAGLLVFDFFLRGLPAGIGGAALTVLVFAFRARIAINPRLMNLVLWALLAGAFLQWWSIAAWMRAEAGNFAVNPLLTFVSTALSKRFSLVVFGAAVVWFVLRRRTTVGAVTVVAVYAFVTFSLWDQRSPLRHYMESQPSGSHPFSLIVRADQQVLWYENALAPWILMQRRSYISGSQQAGQMFNKDTAMELLRRSQAVSVIQTQENICQMLNGLNRNDACQPDLDALREVCELASDLDYLVLETAISNSWIASWTPPVETGGRRPYYYLYECKKILAG